MSLDILKLAETMLSIAVPEAAPIVALAGSVIGQPSPSPDANPSPAAALAQLARQQPAPAAPPAPATHVTQDRMTALEQGLQAALAKIQLLEHATQMHLVATSALTGAIAPAEAVAQLVALEQSQAVEPAPAGPDANPAQGQGEQP